MSIAIIKSPQRYQPSMNPSIWQIESNNANISYFKISVKDGDTNSVIVEELEHVGPPYFQGVNYHLESILKNLVKWNLTNSDTMIEPIPSGPLKPISSYYLNIAEYGLTGSVIQRLSATVSTDLRYIWDSKLDRFNYNYYYQQKYVAFTQSYFINGVQDYTRFLTAKPNYSKVNMLSFEQLYFVHDNIPSYRVHFDFYAHNGSTYLTNTMVGVTGSQMIRINVSPKKLVYNLVVTEFDFNNIHHYNVYITKDGVNRISEIRSYVYEQANCNRTYDNLLWVNNLGGIDSYQFIQPKESRIVTRTNTQKNEYRYDDSGVYSDRRNDILNPSEEIVSVNRDSEYRVWTKRLSDEDSYWIASLIESKQVFKELSDESICPVGIVEDRDEVLQNRYVKGTLQKQYTYRYKGDIIPKDLPPHISINDGLCGCAYLIGFNLPNVEIGASYSYSLQINGILTDTVVIENIVKPSWMGITVSGDNLVFSGTPTLADIDTSIDVSFDLGCGDCSDSYSDTFNVFCGCVSVGSFNPPDVQVGVTYSYSRPLTGTLTGNTISITSIVKPSWMGLTLSGNNIVLSGTPAISNIADNTPVSFNIISCNGTCIQPVSASIDVTCTCVTINDFNMTGSSAVLENAYSYTTPLHGTLTGNVITLTDIVKPSWMGITISLYHLMFTGTPHISDVGYDAPVSFNIVSCGGSCIQPYSTTIDVECGCVMINPESSFNPPNAEVGVTYSYIVGMVGTFTGNSISMTGVSKPSWMGITISGTNLVLSGFPSVSDINYTGVTVSFTLTSCNGTCIQSYSDTITVNCECVEFEGVFSPPNAIIDDPYSFSVQLGGSLNQNIQIVDFVRPAWMSATISNSINPGLTVLNLYGTPYDGYGYDSPSEVVSLGLRSCGGSCTNYVSATISVLGCDAIYFAKPLYLSGSTASIEFNVGDNVFCGTDYRLQNSSGSIIATGSVYATYSNPSNITVSKLDVVGLSEGATYSLYFTKNCCYTRSNEFVFSFTASTCECVGVDGLFDPTNATEGVPYVYTVPLDGSLGVYHHLSGIEKPDWMSIGISGSSVWMTGTPELGDADTGVDVGFTILSCEYFGGCINPYYSTIDVIGSTANNSYITNNTDVPLTGLTILLQGLGGTPEETFNNGGFGYDVGANSTTHFYIPNRSGLQLVSIKVPFVSFDGATAYLSTVGIPAFHNNGPLVFGGDDLEFFNGEGYAITNGMGITISIIPNPF